MVRSRRSQIIFKIGVLKKLSIFTRKHTCVGKEAPTQMFSCEHCEIIRNNFLIEHLRQLLLTVLFLCILTEVEVAERFLFVLFYRPVYVNHLTYLHWKRPFSEQYKQRFIKTVDPFQTGGLKNSHQKQPSRGVFRKRRTPMPKCDFNKVEVISIKFTNLYMLTI